MSKNPFPLTVVDESSGIEVLNNDHFIWQSGYNAGIDDYLQAFDANLKKIECLTDKNLEQIIDQLKARKEVIQ
jgi:hypothetical protein